jgi:hypothetical protein
VCEELLNSTHRRARTSVNIKFRTKFICDVFRKIAWTGRFFFYLEDLRQKIRAKMEQISPDIIEHSVGIKYR